MRLLICSSNYPYPEAPNRGIFMHRTMKALARQTAVDIVVPIPYFPKAIPSERYRRFARIPRDAVLDGLTIHYPRVLVTPKVARSGYGLTYAAGLYPTMARLVAANRPDALLAFWAYPDGFASVLLSRFFRVPVFVAGLGCDVNDLDHHFGKRRMVTWAFQRSTGAIAVSRALGREIEALGVPRERVAVVPNGLDEDFLAQTAERAAPRAGSGRALKTVLYCGWLSPEKDPLCLLEAVRKLFAARADVRLKYVGDGALRGRIEELAAGWGIGDRVILAGEVRHDRVAEHMMQADVLCLPSLREGYPNVLVEALACGLPIVATNVGGVPEIVTDGSRGLLVPPGRPGELAAALDIALDRPWDREALRRAGRARSWDDVAREILEFIGPAVGTRA